jgi:hypothetical protein
VTGLLRPDLIFVLVLVAARIQGVGSIRTWSGGMVAATASTRYDVLLAEDMRSSVFRMEQLKRCQIAMMGEVTGAALITGSEA